MLEEATLESHVTTPLVSFHSRRPRWLSSPGMQFKCVSGAALQYVAFTQAFQSQLQTALPAAGYSGKPAGRQILCTMVLRLYLEGCLGQSKDPPQTLHTLLFL